MIILTAKGEQVSVNITLDDDEELLKIITIFRVLSDPSRLKILGTLTSGDNLCVSEIADKLSMSISRVSHHLSMLDSLGFLKRSQSGKQVYYMIDDDCIIDVMMRVQDHVRGE